MRRCLPECGRRLAHNPFIALEQKNGCSCLRAAVSIFNHFQFGLGMTNKV